MPILVCKAILVAFNELECYNPSGPSSTTTILGFSFKSPSQTRMRHSVCSTVSANSHCRASLRLSLPPDARSLNTAVSVAAGLELSSIMLDYFAATQDEDFLRYTLIPVRKVIQKGT